MRALTGGYAPRTPSAIACGMSEETYTIARVVFLLCVIALILPALFRRKLPVPTMAKYIVGWIAIAAGVALLYDFWKG